MSIDIEDYYQELRQLYALHADPEKARPMKRYMRDQFEYFGIKTPERKLLSKQHVERHGVPEGEDLKTLCRRCFQSEERELQYFVNDLMQKQTRKLDPSFLDLYEELIARKSWWDTVDFLAPKLAGGLFLRFPEQIKPYTLRWIDSDNFWYNRAAIIFQLLYKKKTDTELLFDYILLHADSKEFFVQKGAGWALRQYSRTDPDAVEAFIEGHELPALTVREGLKTIKKS